MMTLLAFAVAAALPVLLVWALGAWCMRIVRREAALDLEGEG